MREERGPPPGGQPGARKGPGDDGQGPEGCGYAVEEFCGVITAVVTGGCGFLGSHLCDYLLGDGYRSNAPRGGSISGIPPPASRVD